MVSPRRFSSSSGPSRASRSCRLWAGIAAGADATAVYAHVKHWNTVVPTVAWSGGLVSALLIGALAGLLPAVRAARLQPTEALWTFRGPSQMRVLASWRS